MTVADRQARDLPLDAHLHTDLSPDSDVPIDVFAIQAVERNIPEIAITDHVDFDPTAPAFAHSTFAQRERVVREAAERWGDRGVAIHFGVEITWDSRWEGEIREHLARHAYDFVIGSVHVYRESPYAAAHVAAWVDGRTLPEIVAPYFDEVAAGARTGLFDAMGHIDFVKRYLAAHIDTRAITMSPELYEPILHALVDTGTALEVNTSGLRQPANETYPAPSISKLYVDLGGRAISIGSDAHRADSFAYALDDGYRAMEAAGIHGPTFGRRGAVRHLSVAGAPNGVAGRSL
jgi:histidinol-phosphatase (PHP family)